MDKLINKKKPISFKHIYRPNNRVNIVFDGNGLSHKIDIKEQYYAFSYYGHSVYVGREGFEFFMNDIDIEYLNI